MKVSYITTKVYPASTADHIYIRELAKAFFNLLGKDFLLIVRKAGEDILQINHVEIPDAFTSRSLSSFLFLLKLFWSQRNKSISGWYMSNDQNILLVLIFLRWFLRKRYMILFDAHMLSGTWKDVFILRFVDKIITTSNVLTEIIASKINDKKKVETMWGGVDMKLYSEVAQSDIEKLREKIGIEGKLVMGYVGRFKSLGHDKGLDSMLESLKYLPEKYVCLLVGGTEEEVREYKINAEEQKVSQRCFIIEKIPYDEVALYQLACDVLVIPYPDKAHFINYGFPMKVYEYIAAQKPIVYSNLKIMNDLLNKYGVSYRASDSRDLALAIQKASASKQITSSDKYTWRTKATKILKFIS